VSTVERCPHPHAYPAVECTGVRLTRRRWMSVCLCGHSKAVHRHPHPGLDCGLCICGHYEAARGRRVSRCAVWGGVVLVCVGFWGAIGIGIIRAITRR
jgi:hypothetical protein